MNPNSLPFANLQLAGMSVEFTMLALAIVLGFVHILLAAHFITNERGLMWNMGPRDETKPLSSRLAGRLDRALANFKETFPLFAVAVLMAAALARHSSLTVWGAQLYLAGRILYLPLYAFGVPVLRTIVWAVATAGIVMVLWAVFTP
jgi:uncharacterized MAPEG superfamily protein